MNTSFHPLVAVVIGPLSQAEWLFASVAIPITFLFTLTWLLSLKLNNFSFVDIAWSYGLAIIAPVYALTGLGYAPRKWIAMTIAMVWSLRLGTYLLFRIKKHHPHEDVRYAVMRGKWADNLARNFFWFFQAQALLILLLSAPILAACVNPTPSLNTLEIFGALVWLTGIVGEAISDAVDQVIGAPDFLDEDDAAARLALGRGAIGVEGEAV